MTVSIKLSYVTVAKILAAVAVLSVTVVPTNLRRQPAKPVTLILTGTETMLLPVEIFFQVVPPSCEISRSTTSAVNDPSVPTPLMTKFSASLGTEKESPAIAVAALQISTGEKPLTRPCGVDMLTP